MTVTAPCRPYLGLVDSVNLDCISVNLAVLLAQQGIPDLRTPFLSSWHFDFDSSAGRPTARLLHDSLEETVQKWSGHQVRWSCSPDSATALAAWRSELEAGRPVLVLADAFVLPWTPHYGKGHMEYSFIVDGIDDKRASVAVTDAFEDKTRWGVARPTSVRLDRRVIDQALGSGFEGRWAVLRSDGPRRPLNLAHELERNALHILFSGFEQRWRQFIAAYEVAGGSPEALERLSLETWRVARARCGHGAWLREHAGDDKRLHAFVAKYVTAVCDRWRRAMMITFIASDRVAAGKSVPSEVFPAVEQAFQAELPVAGDLLSLLQGTAPGIGPELIRIDDRVLETARAHPERLAFGGDEAMTNGRLAEVVQDLASTLATMVQPGGAVAICMAKSPAAVAAMLATLQADLVYVPVDPMAPVRRRELLLQDSGAELLILDASTRSSWSPPGLRNLVLSNSGESLDSSGAHTARDGGRAVERRSRRAEHRCAYVLYTSGSTGAPKGVVITQRNAAAFVQWASSAFPLEPSDQIAVHAPLHFDLPVFDLYAGLAAGATLHLVPHEVSMFPQAVLRFIKERHITVLYAVPSALTALVERSTVGPGDLSDLRLVLYAGEEFRPPSLAKLMAAAPGAAVHNLYGPIETNVVTAFRVGSEDVDRERIPLGTPIPGVELVLVSEAGAFLPPGPAEGEIVVAGECATPGYLNRPEATKGAIVHAIYRGELRRFFRTGDRARRDEQGILHFLGRRDGMVKTRGYRVEIAEVEAALARHPDVADVAVVSRPHPVYTTTLHAFVVFRSGTDAGGSALLDHCRVILPSYMIPADITPVADLPRTSTGKISRLRLADRLKRGEAPT